MKFSLLSSFFKAPISLERPYALKLMMSSTMHDVAMPRVLMTSPYCLVLVSCITPPCAR